MKFLEQYKNTLGLSDEEKITKQITSAVKWIWKYLRKYRLGIFLCFGGGIFLTLITLATSVLSKFLIDSVIYKQKDVLIRAVFTAAFLYIVATAINIFLNRKKFGISVSATNDIRKDVFRSIFNVSWENTLRYRPGDLISRAKNETGMLADGLINNIFSLLRNLMILAGSFAIIIQYDAMFAFLALIGAPVLAFAYRFLMKKMRDLNNNTKISESEVMAFTSEAMYNLQAIKSFSIAGLKIAELTHILNKNKKIKTQQNDYSVFINTLVGILGTAGSAACLAWAVYRLWNNCISYGTMTMFIELASYMTASVKGLIGFFPSLINSATSVMRIREITEMEPEDPEAEAKAEELFRETGGKLNGIEIKNADISYRTQKGVLKDVNISIEKNSMTALIGPSGGGKTTLFRVLLGLIVPEKKGAEILTDKFGRTEISPYTRKFFAYVPQGNTVFSGTVADNIRIASPDISDDEIIKALKLACAYDFVMNLPQNINTEIGEKGTALSEGQAQRISIARALAGNAPVILFDEATSALDIKTERMILENISVLKGSRTCIFSTHRFSVLDVCDKIYYVADNSVYELDYKEAEKKCLDI